MRQLRISGIVRMADQVRRDLSQPLEPAHRGQLLELVRLSLGEVDSILHQHGAKPDHLPAPSRRAYAFLRHLADSPAICQSPISADPACFPSAMSSTPPTTLAHQPQPAESFSFSGLSGFHDQLLDNIAAAVAERRLQPQRMLDIIQNTCRRLDRSVDAQGLDAAHLRPASRDLLAWFRWMSRPEHFTVYVEAVERAQHILAEQAARRLNWSMPLLVHFCPTRCTFQWRLTPMGTRLVLPTPMMEFDPDQFKTLGRYLCRDKSVARTVHDFIHSKSYQSLAHAIQATVGHVERTRGMVYDLVESFERVNREYFGGAITRPRLAWSRSLTRRLFGQYQDATDTVCISSTLDQGFVPVFVLDHVMHHELLHKKHGVQWRHQRRHVHTPAFRSEEHAFRQYREADAFLKTLAR